MKKTLSLAVVLCLVVSLFSGLTISVSAAEVVKVGTADALIAAIAADPAGSFKLTDDIEGITAPLTNASTPFTGTLDGAGHSIDVNITATDYTGTGLFCVTSGATIKNLTLTGAITTGFYDVGAFAGVISTTTFENCINKTTLKTTAALNVGQTQPVYKLLPRGLGGFVGVSNGGTSNFIDCENAPEATFNRNSFNVNYVGGFVGCNNTGVTFTRCINNMSLTIGNAYYAGGFVGYSMNNLTCTDCYNKGNVSLNGYAGGFAGVGRGTVTMTNCYNTGSMSTYAARYSAGFFPMAIQSCTATLTNCFNIGSANNNDVNSVANVVTVGGSDASKCSVTYNNCYYLANETSAVTGLTATTEITAAKLNGAEGTAWKDSDEYDHPLLVSNPEPETTVEPGPGSDPEPSVIEIASAADFAKIAANPDGDFVQTANITASDVILTTATPFTGTYDGGNCTITLNNVTFAANKTGLFSMTDGATIKNLTVTGSVTNPGVNNSGIIVGTVKESTFENLTSNVELTMTATGNVNQVGGIAGIITGSTNETTTFTKCVNYTDIQNGDAGHLVNAGGIVGSIANSVSKGTVTFTSCANHGDLNGRSGTGIGGISGNADNSSGLFTNLIFTDCYNTGDITGQGNSAGFAAMNSRNNTTTLTNCYNLGTIKSTRTQGDRPAIAFVYGNRPGTVTLTNCYNAGDLVEANGTIAHTRLTDTPSATVTYNNCYVLAHNETAPAAGISVVNAAGLKAVNLGSSYEIGTAYPYPQLKSNPQTLAWGFHLLTVTAGENGSVSYTGTKYVKSGDFELTVTPDEGYIIEEITNQAAYDRLGDTVALALADAGETTIAVTFVVRPKEAPTVANTNTFTFDGANYIFVQVNKGYGYADNEMKYGINWRHPTEDAPAGNLYGSGMDANGFFGMQLDGFKGDLRVRSFVVPVTTGAFTGNFSDYSVITAAE